MLSLLCLTPAVAQEDDVIQVGQATFKGNALFVGVKGGLTFTSMTQPKQSDLYDKSGIGFSAGLAVNLRFGAGSDMPPASGVFGLGVEGKYVQNNVKTLADEGDFKMGYFEVPVFARIYPFYKNAATNSLALELGAAVAGTMSKDPDVLTIDNGIDRVSYPVKELKGFDIRPFVGVSYGIPLGSDRDAGGNYKVRHLADLNVRYYLGTSNLAKDMECKMNHLEVSVAFLFSALKF
jgi:hypothetical protein